MDSLTFLKKLPEHKKYSNKRVGMFPKVCCNLDLSHVSSYPKSGYWEELDFCQKCLKDNMTSKPKGKYRIPDSKNTSTYVAFRKMIDGKVNYIFQKKASGFDFKKNYQWPAQYGFPGGAVESKFSNNPWKELCREVFEETCHTLDVSDMKIAQCFYLRNRYTVFLFVIDFDSNIWTELVDSECSAFDKNIGGIYPFINPSHAFCSASIVQTFYNESENDLSKPIIAKKITGALLILFGEDSLKFSDERVIGRRRPKKYSASENNSPNTSGAAWKLRSLNARGNLRESPGPFSLPGSSRFPGLGPFSPPGSSKSSGSGPFSPPANLGGSPGAWKPKVLSSRENPSISTERLVPELSLLDYSNDLKENRELFSPPGRSLLSCINDQDNDDCFIICRDKLPNY